MFDDNCNKIILNANGKKVIKCDKNNCNNPAKWRTEKVGSIFLCYCDEHKYRAGMKMYKL